MKNKFSILPNRNYERISTGHIHTGQQILNLLKLAQPFGVIAVLADIRETDKPAYDPDDEYGIPAEADDQPPARINCPTCGASIPNDGACWYCENEPGKSEA